jgi:hypothetical protein
MIPPHFQLTGVQPTQPRKLSLEIAEKWPFYLITGSLLAEMEE